jgi:hypothetical protein
LGDARPGPKAGVQPVELSLQEFTEKWLRGLEKDGLHVGLNWTGPRAAAYDLEPSRVRPVIEVARKQRPPVTHME